MSDQFLATLKQNQVNQVGVLFWIINNKTYAPEYIYHDLLNRYQWFEQLQKKKECNETWCRAPAGIRTESPRNCTTVQPWTAYSSSSRCRSLRLKYQPGSRIGSWSAGISTPCSLATCHVQTHTNTEFRHSSTCTKDLHIHMKSIL